MGTLRKILTTGMGAALMTEGSLRSAIADIDVTKQAKNYLAKVLAGELKRFLEHIDLKEEIRKALSGVVVEVEAKVRFSSDSSLKTKKLSLKKFQVRKA